MRRKIELYILSLALLFIFILIITIRIPTCAGPTCQFQGLGSLIADNVVPSICAIFLAYAGFAYWRLQDRFLDAPDIPLRVVKVKDINYEHLTFLATYVVPLISFDFNSSRQMTVLFLLLIVMGGIYIKTDLFYANPSLALMGFLIFEAECGFKSDLGAEAVILISRDHISVGDNLHYLQLDKRIYYVRKYLST